MKPLLFGLLCAAVPGGKAGTPLQQKGYLEMCSKSLQQRFLLLYSFFPQTWISF